MTIEDRLLTPEMHSNIVGGSTAARRINCPASLQLEAKLPDETKKEESVYAAEGTALHDAMAHILVEDVEDIQEVLGREFYNHTITKELLEEALRPCVRYIDDLFFDDGVRTFEVEKSSAMPGIDGAFGTSDFIGRSDEKTVVVDYKFGAGVPVYASYRDAQDNLIPNHQLMFYARAAMESHPHLFGEGDDWPVELIILQPRVEKEDGRIDSRHTVTIGELREWHDMLLEKMKLAQSANPGAPCKGDHCRFARCQTICPAFTGPLFDMSALVKTEGTEIVRTDKMPDAEYGEALSNILELTEIVAELRKEAVKQATMFLEDGYAVPGWDLFAKRKSNDKWKDDTKAERYLGRAGLSIEERRVVKPITPAVARKALKKIGKELREDLHVDIGTSSGYSLGRADGRRTPIERNQIANLATALKDILS